MAKKQSPVRRGIANEVVTVIIRLELPEHLYNHYASEAAKRNREPEQVMAERLTRCQTITGSGIYFDEEQKKRLSNVIGHTVADAEGALQRLETSTVVSVEGYDFALDPRLIQRLKTRVFRGERYEDVMHREIVRSLMTYAGMNPPLSNTGGWWRRPQPKPNGHEKEQNEQDKGNASVV